MTASKFHTWERSYLYKLTFPNGMVYIGCTNNIKQRWAGKGAHYKKHTKLYEAIQEFGWDNIERTVIAKLPESTESTEAIKALEKELIRAYSGRCYNSQSNPEWYENNPSYQKGKRYEPRLFWTAFGETKPVKDWCAEYNISSCTVKKRMENQGLTIEQALTFPPVPRSMRSKHKPLDYWKSLGLLKE